MANRPRSPLRPALPPRVGPLNHPDPHAGSLQSKPARTNPPSRSKNGCWYVFCLSEFLTPTNSSVGNVELVVRILPHPSKLFHTMTAANAFHRIEVKCDEQKPICGVSSYSAGDHVSYY